MATVIVPDLTDIVPFDILKRFKGYDTTPEIGDDPSDEVAIFSQSSGKFYQVFTKARPVSVTVKPMIQAMSHPVESGATIVDHTIILPIEIEMMFVIDPIDYKVTYAEIVQIFIKSTLLTVQTKTGRYDRMIMAAIPHEEKPDHMNSIPISIAFHEVQIVGSKFGSLASGTTKSAASADTKKTGEKQKQSAAKELLVSAQESFRSLF